MITIKDLHISTYKVIEMKAASPKTLASHYMNERIELGISEFTDLLMFNRSFPLSNNQPVRFELLPLQGLLSVDHLVRLGRVLDDPGTRLGSQLLAGLGEGRSQVAPVAPHRLLVRLKPDKRATGQDTARPVAIILRKSACNPKSGRDEPDRPAFAHFADKWRGRCFQQPKVSWRSIIGVKRKL